MNDTMNQLQIINMPKGCRYMSDYSQLIDKSLFKFCSATFLLQQVSPSPLPNRT